MQYKPAYVSEDRTVKSLRKVNNKRFTKGSFEYRLKWIGGHSCYVSVEAMKAGKKNFEFYDGVGVRGCANASEAIEKIRMEVR